jgi:glucoamylase
VYERYCTESGRRGTRRNLEVYSLRRPIQRVNAGDTLRILDGERFELVWTADNWATFETTPSRSLGSAGFSVDISAGPGPGKLSWTLHWPEAGRWLGYNVEIQVVSG